MLSTQAISAVLFLGVSSFVLLLYLLVGGRRSRLDTRLRQLANPSDDNPSPDAVADFARATLPKMGSVLMPKKEEDRTKLQARLIHAGLYSRQAMVVFLGVKMLLVVTPAFIGLFLGLVNIVPIQQGIVFGALTGIFGLIGPSFWLDRKKAARQSKFRRGLPDALDVMVICLEGGSSLSSALRRVSTELRVVHPVLAMELTIVDREAQFGRSTGEALRQFADRADLEDIRGLATVILQGERYGASLVKALRVHADSLRNKRIMDAEEMAQKAIVKLLIPTVIFILPALFLALLGPIGLHVMEMLNNVKTE